MEGISLPSMDAGARGVMRYSGGTIDWTKEELRDRDQKTRKMITLNRCLHPVASNIVYEAERRRGLIKCGGGHNS